MIWKTGLSCDVRPSAVAKAVSSEVLRFVIFTSSDGVLDLAFDVGLDGGINLFAIIPRWSHQLRISR